MENVQESSSRRWPFFLIGMLLFILGPISLIVQFQLHDRNMPWQLPILATLGVVLMAASLAQRWGIWRGIVLFLSTVVCGLEWFMLLVGMQMPAYEGPQVGQPVPAFSTALASGAVLTNDDLAKGQPTVLLFYRGHW